MLSRRFWYFDTTAGSATFGLVTKTEEKEGVDRRRAAQGGLHVGADANGNQSVASALTTLDVGLSYQKQMKTEQTVDVYGNVTLKKIHDYGSLTTPARTYPYTYETASGYLTRYLRNLLKVATVMDGTVTHELVSNTYDNEYGTAAPLPFYTKATTNNKWVKTTYDGFGRPILSETGHGTTTVSAVNITGSTTWSDGASIDWSKMPRNQREHLVNELPSGPAAKLFDAPGLSGTRRNARRQPVATVVSANIKWDFILDVSVTGVGETVKCPQIRWTATLSWQTVKGNPMVSGSARWSPLGNGGLQ